MKRLLTSALFLVAATASALAMSQSSMPPKFPIAWANSAGAAYLRSIPVPSQIGIQNCAASLTDGFPPLTFVPAAAGGCPPFGQDMNGILKQLSQWSQWQGAGGAVPYDSAFSAAIGGYPKGAILSNASNLGCYWLSSVDNNASDPDTGGSNWTGYCPGGANVALGGTSTGSANAQAVTTTPFVVQPGAEVTFTAGFSNTGPLKVNINGAGLVNVFRHTQLGTSAAVGGEVVAGQLVTIKYDGTQYQCMSCRAVTVGAMEYFSGSTAPLGKAFMDGSCFSVSSQPDLDAVIGGTYGACGAGTFRIPDTRGRFVASQDNQGVNGAAGRITASPGGCDGTALANVCGSQVTAITAQSQLPNVSFPNSGITAGTPTVPAFPQAGVATVNGQNSIFVVGNAPTVNFAQGSVSIVAQGAAASGGSSTPIQDLPPLIITTMTIQF